MGQIENYLDRPKSYYNVDGVGELGIGFMMLAFSQLLWLQLNTPKDSLWNQMYTACIYVGLMCLIIHYGSKTIKKHITYPRTGFVEYRKRDTLWRPLIVALVVSSLVSIALVAAVRSHWDITTAATLAAGLLLAGGYARGFARAVHWKWVVAVVMAMGTVVIAMLPADLLEAVVSGGDGKLPAKLAGARLLSFFWFGAVTLVSGGISLGLYLRRTQPPARDAQ